MADRDSAAFASLITDEAVFFGSKDVMRGKDAVVGGWKRYFEGASAPFSWKPTEVEVGRRIGTFNSIWQRQSDGSWKVIFDKGCPPCECPAK